MENLFFMTHNYNLRYNKSEQLVATICRTKPNHFDAFLAALMQQFNNNSSQYLHEQLLHKENQLISRYLCFCNSLTERAWAEKLC